MCSGGKHGGVGVNRVSLEEPIFRIIEKQGGVPEKELYQVFNMGIGMVVMVAGEQADAVLRFVRLKKQKAWIIGEVAKGHGVAGLV